MMVMGEAKARRNTKGDQFRAPPRRCGYCGEAASTRDHVPPKAILRKPFPKLITVPACAGCNARWGNELDEVFRNLLSLRIGNKKPNAADFWTRVERGMRQGGPATRLKVAETDGWKEITPVGPRRHPGKLIGIDVSSHDAMIARLVRGLYYHLYGKPLGLSTKVETGVLADVGVARVSPIFSEHERHFVGPDFEF
jgi:hypothetical protein